MEEASNCELECKLEVVLSNNGENQKLFKYRLNSSSVINYLILVTTLSMKHRYHKEKIDYDQS